MDSWPKKSGEPAAWGRRLEFVRMDGDPGEMSYVSVEADENSNIAVEPVKAGDLEIAPQSTDDIGDRIGIASFRKKVFNISGIIPGGQEGKFIGNGVIRFFS